MNPAKRERPPTWLPSSGTSGYRRLVNDTGYFQTIKFSRQNWDTVDMQLNGEPLRHLWEYYSSPSKNANRETVNADEVIFLGYGIDDPAYSDYRGHDVAGKTIIIFAGEPRGRDGNFMLSGTKDPSEYSLDDGRKTAVGLRTRSGNRYRHRSCLQAKRSGRPAGKPWTARCG